VRQRQGSSTLQGNESELDAWTSTFIRDFHRSYVLADDGSTCYVDSVSEFRPLLDYYHRSNVSSTQRDASAKRIIAYYNTTVSGHPGHTLVFRYWIHRSIKRVSVTPNLADRLNTDLQLGVNAADPLKTTRQFPCGTLKTLSYLAPTVSQPSPPGPAPKSGTPTPKGGGAP
jgi:hypothetical protein